MKHSIYKQIISIILALSLFGVGLPSYAGKKSFLAPPGNRETGERLNETLVDEFGRFEIRTDKYSSRISFGMSFANCAAVPFDGRNWDSGYLIYKNGSILIMENSGKFKRILTSEGYQHIVRYYGNILTEYYNPVFEQARKSLADLGNHLQSPEKVFSEKAINLREIIRGDDSPRRWLWREFEKLNGLYGEELNYFINTIDRLIIRHEDSPYITLWQAVLEMGNRPDKGGDGYREMLITIANNALEEIQESIDCLRDFETLTLTPSGLIDLEASANRKIEKQNDKVTVDPCPLLGEPFEVWTYKGFSAFNIPFGHNYEYSLLSLLRLYYGFLFDELRVDYHKDVSSMRILNVHDPDFDDVSLETWNRIKENAKEMDVQKWHSYLYNQGTLLRTLLLMWGGSNSDKHYYYQRIVAENQDGYIRSTDGHWSYELEPDDIPKLKGRNIKRILVIEDDFVCMFTPSSVRAEIERRVREFKEAGLEFSGVIFVETDTLQHWEHNFFGRISELYPMRKQINRMWLKELAEVYGDDKKCQGLVNLVKRDKRPKFKYSYKYELGIASVKQWTIEIGEGESTFKVTGLTGLVVPERIRELVMQSH